MKGFLRDNGLSLVLIALFVLFLAGQTVFGWLNYNDEKDEHHQPQIGFRQYLGTGAFGEAVFENWESEFLQMGLYVTYGLPFPTRFFGIEGSRQEGRGGRKCGLEG